MVDVCVNAGVLEEDETHAALVELQLGGEPLDRVAAHVGDLVEDDGVVPLNAVEELREAGAGVGACRVLFLVKPYVRGLRQVARLSLEVLLGVEMRA